MDFNIQEEQQAVVDLARKILEDHATNERLAELEAGEATHDPQLWQALAGASLLGTAIPEEFGGVGLDFMALCLLLREVGRTVAPVPVYPSLVLGALPLIELGTQELKRTWLPEIANGKRIVTAALSELDSSDPLQPTTRAERAGSGYRLTGVKTNVPSAGDASHVVTPARVDDGSIGLFLVGLDAAGGAAASPGVELSTQKTSDGRPHTRLSLTDVEIDAGTRLDVDVDGAVALQRLAEHAIAARCMMQLGVTERALEMTAAYGRERVQFDRPIGSFQAVHQRAADAYINVEAIRLSALEATWRLSSDLPATDHVAVAKFWAAEGGHLASYACQHLHGGIGIDVDYPLHRYFLWAIQIEHELGSARHQLERLGRRIAAEGLPAD